MSHSPVKTSETRFVHPWHTTARYRRHTRRRARAEQHSGAHATLLEKQDNEEYRPDLSWHIRER